MKKKLLKTIKENGFLLFLFTCVCLVAFSTIFIITQEVGKPENDEDLIVLEKEEEDDSSSTNKSEDSDVDKNDSEEEDKDTLETATKDDDTEKTEEIEEEQKKEEETEEQEESEQTESLESQEETNTQNNQGYIWPLSGEVITVFTTDNLIYSETLDEWRGHAGIDIEAELGTKVKAVKDGTVKKVEEDDLWGIAITIDHGNDMETKYANLGTKEMVEEGIQVKQGDHIGTVGETASIEMLIDSHLHFEARKDGELVDPRSILD